MSKTKITKKELLDRLENLEQFAVQIQEVFEDIIIPMANSVDELEENLNGTMDVIDALLDTLEDQRDDLDALDEAFDQLVDDLKPQPSLISILTTANEVGRDNLNTFKNVAEGLKAATDFGTRLFQTSPKINDEG